MAMKELVTFYAHSLSSRITDGEYIKLITEELLFRNIIFRCIYSKISVTKSVRSTTKAIQIRLNNYKLRNASSTITKNQTVNIDQLPQKVIHHLKEYLTVSGLAKFQITNLEMYKKCNPNSIYSAKYENDQFKFMLNKLMDIKVEFKSFLTLFIRRFGREIITFTIFTELYQGCLSQDIFHNIPKRINQKIFKAILSKKQKINQGDRSGAFLNSDIVSHIAGYLDQSDYVSFQIVSRSVFIGCNDPNQLRMIYIRYDDDDFDEIPFDKFPLIQSVRVVNESNVGMVEFSVRNVQCMVDDLLFVEKKDGIINTKVREIAYCVAAKRIIRRVRNWRYWTDTKAKAFNGSKITEIIDAVIGMLPEALSKATDPSLIENVTVLIPDAMQSYTEREPKLSELWRIIGLLLREVPDKTRDRIIAPDTWKLVVQILDRLEHDAVTYLWAKNDDKLLLLEIIQESIRSYDVSTNMDLINVLTTQFVVTTTSEYVAPHMERVVIVTFELLAAFARESDGDQDDWIKRFVQSNSFKWMLTDVVVPHHVYNGDGSAADTILVFVEIVAKYLEDNGLKRRLIREICRKWESLRSTTFRSRPRNQIFKLLQIIMTSEEAHRCFMEHGGLSLLTFWIFDFFYGHHPSISDQDIVYTHNIALDFFQFHVRNTMKLEYMRDMMENYVRGLDVFEMKYRDKAGNVCWNILLDKAQRLKMQIDIILEGDKV